MSVAICNPFDVDLNACGPLAPDSDSNLIITASEKKFGAGSARPSNITSQGNATWNALSTKPGDQGAYGVWVRVDDGASYELLHVMDFIGVTNDGGLISFIVRNKKVADQFFIGATMYNAAAGVVFTLQHFETHLTGWHYIEFNWLWNDAGGITELSLDGVVKVSSTLGNTETRVVAQDMDYTLRIDEQLNNEISYMDDPTFWDTRQHVGNFAVPTSPNCICAAAIAGRMNTLSAPLGCRTTRLSR